MVIQTVFFQPFSTSLLLLLTVPPRLDQSINEGTLFYNVKTNTFVHHCNQSQFWNDLDKRYFVKV